MPQILNPYFNLFESNKVNINSSDSSRNLALAVGEATAGRSYDLVSNPSGSFRAFNLDPQVKLLSAASVSQPLYGANLKIELNGSAGTTMSSVSAINAYSLVSGSGHTVSKNVGMGVLADVGNNLIGTIVTNNFSLEVNGVASRTGTVVTNARSVVINCPNHGTTRRGLFIGIEGTTGLAAGTNNRSLEVLGTSSFQGNLFCGSAVTAVDLLAQNNVFGFLGSFSNLRITVSAPPASASAAGVRGDIEYDSDFLYVCTATNTWKRAALTTW